MTTADWSDGDIEGIAGGFVDLSGDEIIDELESEAAQ
jgi:hypothetical protein